MSRLFITPREVNFISDLTKEFMKDVVGHKIYYYSISETKSNINETYDEATKKVYNDPIELEAMVEWNPEEVTTTQFGIEQKSRIAAFVHARDLLDKGIEVFEGDFFSFGEKFFEIIHKTTVSNVYGQIEHKVGFRLEGREARRGQFTSIPFGPTNEAYSDSDAVQDTFVQQRGFTENREGPTGDKREMISRGIVDEPISGPAEISDRDDSSNAGSNFYDET
jgi:hypothetical protein